MFSTTVSIIVAVGLMSAVSGLARERRSALYEAALKCTRAGLKADISALQSGGSTDNAAKIIEAGCTYGREFVACIKKINPTIYESPVPNIVHFLIYYEWQHQVLAKEAGLCENMHITDDLKKIAIDAGLIGNGNLSNIVENPLGHRKRVRNWSRPLTGMILAGGKFKRDFVKAAVSGAVLLRECLLRELRLYYLHENDPYEQCAGDAMRKCILKGETIAKEGIYQDFLSATTDYIACYEEEGLICDAPILHHFIAIMKAYQQHLEENRAKFAHMIHEISVPSN